MNIKSNVITRNINSIASAGLAAKGLVYVLLGILAFMAAFGINGKSSRNTSKSGVFDFIYDQPAGTILLWVVVLGLVCYVIWRVIEAFADTEGKGKDVKGILARGRYLFSGLVYGALAVKAFNMLVFHEKGSGNKSREATEELLSQPFGQWLVGLVAFAFLAVGIYQIFYGLSEKYRKHVNKYVPAKAKPLFLNAGKIGYVARGIVWLLFAYLFFQAAFSANSAETGDTPQAFSVLSQSSYGPYLLALIAVGLVFYGLFNFVRARYEEIG
ncbi:MAG: DUF1206 domain-containing protein [Bacteroidota bacterium]